MDTQTVLDIIKMIDTRTTHAQNFLKRNEEHLLPYEIEQQKGKIEGFKLISDYLQEYIEQLVNQAENNLNAGD